MNKIKIGIDPSLIWEESGGFRDVIKNMSLNTDGFDIYIITKSSEVELITKIANTLGLDLSTNVFYSIPDDIAVEAKVSSLGIQVYLSGDYELVKLINNNKIAYAIIVNAIQDTYYMQPKWFTVMNFWVSKIDNTNNNTNKC